MICDVGVGVVAVGRMQEGGGLLLLQLAQEQGFALSAFALHTYMFGRSSPWQWISSSARHTLTQITAAAKQCCLPACPRPARRRAKRAVQLAGADPAAALKVLALAEAKVEGIIRNEALDKTSRARALQHAKAEVEQQIRDMGESRDVPAGQGWPAAGLSKQGRQRRQGWEDRGRVWEPCECMRCQDLAPWESVAASGLAEFSKAWDALLPCWG